MSDGGKGDKQRPTNKTAYDANYDLTFKKKVPVPIDVEDAQNEDEEFNRIEKKCK